MQVWLNAIRACLLTLVLLSSANINAQAPAQDAIQHDISEQPSIEIQVPFIELRSGPGRGYPITQVLEQGETVTVLVKRTAWFKVQDKRGQQGWFHQKSLTDFSFNRQPVVPTEQAFNDYLMRTWEGGISYGELESANFYRINLGFNFSSVISTELSLGKAIGDISDNDLAELSLLAQPFPDWSVSPYLGISAGIIRTTPHSVLADAERRQNTLMGAAIGAKYYLARNFVLRAEYKYALVLTDRDDNEEVRLWTLGFNVFF